MKECLDCIGFFLNGSGTIGLLIIHQQIIKPEVVTDAFGKFFGITQTLTRKFKDKPEHAVSLLDKGGQICLWLIILGFLFQTAARFF